MSTVPVFTPNGEQTDIPAARLADAVKLGAIPGVHVKTASGEVLPIPANRTPDAIKAGATMVPIEDQPVQHPGFWASMGADLKGMIPSWTSLAHDATGMHRTDAEQQQMDAQAQARKQAGYSAPYRAVAPVAEAIGVNVPGMEQSAREGDVAGVAGHAAAVPTVMAATAGLARGATEVAAAAPAAADLHPAFQKALAKVQQITPKQAAQGVGAVAGAVEGHGAFSAPGAYYGAKTAGSIAEGVLGKERANAPIFGPPKPASTEAAPSGAPIERDATLDQRNIPDFAGEEKPPLVDMTDKLATEIAAKRNEPTFTAADRLQARSLLREALKSSTGDVVDSAVAPDKNYGTNLATKAKVDFYLQGGDVANAESALDVGAKQNNPAWQPLNRQPVPSVNDIRARIQAESKIPPADTAGDIQDTRALQQEMNWDLQRHGWNAESEARREFIARNSTGMTKGELAKRFAATSGKGSPAAGSSTEDLTDALQKSLDVARQQRGAK